MIPVPNPIPEPPLFDANCRVPGAAWLAANPGEKCRKASNLWKPFRWALGKGFSMRCGYLAVRLLPGGEIDHHVSCNEDRTKAFEWSNFRYVSGLLNRVKGALDKKRIRVLDPFAVRAGWFRVILPSFELVLTGAVDPDLRELAQLTIEKLGLDKGYEAVQTRWSAYESHWNDGDIDLVGLRKDAPLIAEAVEARMREGKPLPDPQDSPKPPPVAARTRPYGRKKAKKPKIQGRARR